MPTQLRWSGARPRRARLGAPGHRSPGPRSSSATASAPASTLLQPFVDARRPAIEVVRFDVPGAGGSPTPRLPYNFPLLACFATRLLDAAGIRPVRRARHLVGRRARPAARLPESPSMPPTGAGQHRHRHALMVPASPWVLSKMLTPRRYRDPAYARSIAAQLYGGRLRKPNPTLCADLLHDHSRIGSRTRLPVPAAGRGRLDEPARAAADPAADAGPVRQ